MVACQTQQNVVLSCFSLPLSLSLSGFSLALALPLYLSIYFIVSPPTHCSLSVFILIVYYLSVSLQMLAGLTLPPSLPPSISLCPSLFLFLPPIVQTQSPVLQSNMLVPMATGSTPPHPSISLVAPPLPVQNGPTTASKVIMFTLEPKQVLTNRFQKNRKYHPMCQRV